MTTKLTMAKAKAQRIGNVAYRGMWGGTAYPGSVEAIRRAYHHGVPALVDDRDECTVTDVLDVASDPSLNAFSRPVYLSVAERPSRLLMAGFAADITVYAIVRGPSTEAWAVWLWAGEAWRRAGAYVPATAPIDALSGVAFESGLTPVIIYEAPSVVAMFGERSMIGELHEEQIQQAVISYAGARATIARVADLFEPDGRPATAQAA